MRLVKIGLLLTSFCVAIGFTGCGNGTVYAGAGLNANAAGLPKYVGNASFFQGGNEVVVDVLLYYLPPGKYGLHLHEVGKCELPDFASAGEHWNPTAQPHGGPKAAMHHAGDLGNIEVGSERTGKLTLRTTSLSMNEGAPTYLVGRSVILHEGTDDLMTQPMGNSGPRLACGTIVYNTTN